MSLAQKLTVAVNAAEAAPYPCACEVTVTGLLLRGWSPSTAVRPQRTITYSALESMTDAAINQTVADIMTDLSEAPGGRGLLAG